MTGKIKINKSIVKALLLYGGINLAHIYYCDYPAFWGYDGLT